MKLGSVLEQIPYDVMMFLSRALLRDLFFYFFSV